MWISHFFYKVNRAPVAMGRPRFNTWTKRTYTPPEKAAEMTKIKTCIKTEMEAQKTPKIEQKTPIYAQLVFVHQRPKNHKKTYDREPKTTKPDIDNIAKMYLDAITKAGLWDDDNQITLLKCEDLYGATDEEPHVIVNISIWSSKEDNSTWLYHDQV